MSATKQSRILVLGAGELGLAVLQALSTLRAGQHVPPVCVLLRPSSDRGATRRDDGAIRTLGVDVVEADLITSSIDELAAVFAPFSQIICCTGFIGGPGTQRRITKAVLQAKVDHYIPWQFGVDYDTVGRGSGQQVWDEQLDVREMLRQQDCVRWTILSTGIFTSFVFLAQFGVADLVNRHVAALGSWEYSLTATTPEDIGRVTAAVAAEPALYTDRVVYVAGDTFTYRKLADTIDRVLNTTVSRTLLTRDMLQADVEQDPSDNMAKYRLAFARPDGVAWPVADTLNVKLGMAMVDVESWIRRWQQSNSDHPGAS